MLVTLLILIISIFSTNGFPSSFEVEAPYAEFPNLDEQRAIFGSPEQKEVIFRAPLQQEAIIQASEQNSALFQAPEYQQAIFQVPEQQETIFQTPEQQEAVFQTPVQQEAVYQTPVQQEAVYQTPIQHGAVYHAPQQQEAIFQAPVQQGVVFENSGQKEVISQIPEHQEAIFQTSEQQEAIPQTPVDQTQYIDDYYTSGGTNLAGQETDFTVSCVGANKLCTSKNDCVNGYIDSTRSGIYSSTQQNQQCRIGDQTCCTIKKTFPIESPVVNPNPSEVKDNTRQGAAAGTSNAFAAPTHVQVGCAAALLCVEEKFCTLDGTISSEPVTFSEKQLYRRVPLNSCKNPENGIVGKCCRDPNYVDPWPTGNLPANYSGGFDEQGFPTFLNIAKVRPAQPIKPTTTYRPVQQNPVNVIPNVEAPLVPENSDIFPKTLVPPVKGTDVKGAPSTLQCGHRNKVIQSIEGSKTGFAEIPWQAMVLHSKERKILCSGALVGTQDVLTAANCVDSFSPGDVSVKLGEWKLGYELKHEEPLPFQILNVSSINIHSGYVRGYGDHDLAILHLESPATFDRHINPLCLPEANHLVQSDRACITTGWGQSILQAHYAGAIMNVVGLNMVPTQQCKERLLSANFETDIVDEAICAEPKEEKNNVCETDVGGPLACRNEQGLYDLVGIYSQDIGCLATNQVAVFAPLDQTWLKETMLKSAHEESKVDVIHDQQLFTDDYRKSSLDTDNQYLPPI